MASLVNNIASIIANGIADMEQDLLTTYGYTNAVVFKSRNPLTGAIVEAHLIIADSNYFVGDSHYDRAPVGSLGISKAGGSKTTLYTKFTSSGAGAGACWAAAE